MSRDLYTAQCAHTHTHVHMCVPVVKTPSPRPVSEADPEMEIQVPGAYLGQDPRKHRQGMRNETGQGSQYRMCLSQVITMANRPPPAGALWETGYPTREPVDSSTAPISHRWKDVPCMWVCVLAPCVSFLRLLNKVAHTGQFQQQTLTVSQSWRLEVQGQSEVGRETACHKSLLASGGLAGDRWHSLACRCITLISAFIFTKCFSHVPVQISLFS